MRNDKDSLVAEINRAFPFVDMPEADDIPHHLMACPTCDGLAADLEAFRGQAIEAEAIRMLHQEMSHLSAKAWRWVLPHYLRYCLTPEAAHSSFETEFLIYSLSPIEEFEADTQSRLSLINSDQIRVLRDFLAYLALLDHWSTYCPSELAGGIAFLQGVLDLRANLGSGSRLG